LWKNVFSGNKNGGLVQDGFIFEKKSTSQQLAAGSAGSFTGDWIC
jgi:hypothetical protein